MGRVRGHRRSYLELILEGLDIREGARPAEDHNLRGVVPAVQRAQPLDKLAASLVVAKHCSILVLFVAVVVCAQQAMLQCPCGDR